MTRLSSLFTGLIVFVLITWGTGAFIFSQRVSNWTAPASPKADAIVVLTGGENRLKVAVALLQEQKGRRLLITGVYPDTGRISLVRLLGTDADPLFDCCIDLDHRAVDTETNALETAEWVKTNGFSSIIVVTASYHMPRTLVELSRRLPKTHLLPFPVMPEAMEEDQWWHKADLTGLVLGEYNKYLVSLLRAQLSSGN